jgi:hypothetical protein
LPVFAQKQTLGEKGEFVETIQVFWISPGFVGESEGLRWTTCLSAAAVWPSGAIWRQSPMQTPRLPERFARLPRTAISHDVGIPVTQVESSSIPLATGLGRRRYKGALHYVELMPGVICRAARYWLLPCSTSLFHDAGPWSSSAAVPRLPLPISSNSTLAWLIFTIR